MEMYEMTYVLPFDLYGDCKELMFATEVSKNIVEALKEQTKKNTKD